MIPGQYVQVPYPQVRGGGEERREVRGGGEERREERGGGEERREERRRGEGGREERGGGRGEGGRKGGRCGCLAPLLWVLWPSSVWSSVDHKPRLW